MTVLSGFATGLVDILDPATGLGHAVTLDGSPINALVRYDTDADEDGGKFDVMDLDVLRRDCAEAPAYRAVAVVEGKDWYYWKQMAGDAVSFTLRFRANPRFQFSKKEYHDRHPG